MTIGVQTHFAMVNEGLQRLRVAANSMYQWYGEAANRIVYLEFATCGIGQL